jgi:uncharacterized membrane protein YdbT with pleckstrin-like domain
MTVHPSAKLLMPFYAVGVLSAIGIAVYISRLTEKQPYWLFVIPAVILIWTTFAHFKLLLVRLHLEEYRIRYEAGLISRSTRILELRNVQDIRVNRSLIQRMINTGDVSIETAGPTGRLQMLNVDDPQKVADAILEAAHKHYKADQSGSSGGEQKTT